jgi:hypothetical protein
MRLAEWPLPYVRVKCGNCDREGRLKIDGLIERFGADREMFVVREKLTETSCKRPDKKQPCMSILPDALLVQAIMETDETKVIDQRLLAEAREWKEKSGK